MKKRIFSFSGVFMWRFAAVLIFTIIVLYGFLGEKVAVRDGAGWDGVVYREMARSFSSDIVGGGYNGYNIQRVAPFALLNTIYRIFGFPLDNDSLMSGMILLQLVALLLAVYVYFRISDQLKLSWPTEMIGFFMLFFNYTCLKYVEYYPFLTDVFAYLISLSLFLFFLRGNRMAMVLCSLVGAFVWPTLLGVGLCLAFLPVVPFDLNDRKVELDGKGIWFFRLLRWCALSAIPVMIAAIAFLSTRVKGHASMRELYWATDYGTPLLLFLSVVAVSCFLFLLIRSFRFDPVALFLKVKRELTLKSLAGIVGGFLLVKLVILFFANDSEAWGISHMLMHTVLRSVTAPLVFLENHFVFFGLIPVFMILLWRPLLQQIGRFGMPYWIIIAEFLFLVINSESRYMIYLLPFFVFPLLCVLERFVSVRKIVVPVALFSLLKSMFWFPINEAGIEECFLREDYLSFPAQRYFLMHGPWQTHEMYALFMVMAVVTLLVCRQVLLAISKEEAPGLDPATRET